MDSISIYCNDNDLVWNNSSNQATHNNVWIPNNNKYIYSDWNNNILINKKTMKKSTHKSTGLFILIILIIVLTIIIAILLWNKCAQEQKNPITEQEITEAQKTWGDGVVAIGKAYTNNKDYRQTALNHLNDLYAYQTAPPVLFKPTKTAEKQFRLTEKGALSYFVNDDKNFPEDKGFALQPWTNIRFENVGTFLHDNYAVAMGNYYFTPEDGEEVKVEYTFGYLKNKDGDLKINVHHSSLPYVKE